jgi:hypothetical protein
MNCAGMGARGTLQERKEDAMNTIQGTVKDGQIVLKEPLSWPDGTPVLVEAVGLNGTPVAPEEENMDKAAIERQLALMDQIEPLIMTPEEEAEWQAARQAQKEFEKATFNERAEKLRRMWE